MAYTCQCGATLEYKQDLLKEQGEVYPTWKCRECLSEVPSVHAERIKHRHPS
ncbi:hypothetical protein [Halosimplex marinum]|jgi:predicted SprT family Zn-dependent metalloprotease|uniref:hypothetical protein n=1 Tax=Halosimplex TaxID=171163 RepID=UPI003F56E3B8